MSRTIKMNQKNPIYLDLKRFNHKANKKKHMKLQEKFQKLFAKNRWQPEESKAICEMVSPDIFMEWG